MSRPGDFFVRLRGEAQARGGWRAVFWRQAKFLIIPFVLIIAPGAIAFWLTDNILFIGATFVAVLAYGRWVRRSSR